MSELIPSSHWILSKRMLPLIENSRIRLFLLSITKFNNNKIPSFRWKPQKILIVPSRQPINISRKRLFRVELEARGVGWRPRIHSPSVTRYQVRTPCGDLTLIYKKEVSWLSSTTYFPSPSRRYWCSRKDPTGLKSTQGSLTPGMGHSVRQHFLKTRWRETERTNMRYQRANGVDRDHQMLGIRDVTIPSSGIIKLDIIVTCKFRCFGIPGLVKWCMFGNQWVITRFVAMLRILRKV